MGWICDGEAAYLVAMMPCKSHYESKLVLQGECAPYALGQLSDKMDGRREIPLGWLY
jgi:hypothetical protein